MAHNNSNLTAKVIDFFKSAQNKTYNYKQVAFALEINNSQERAQLIEILHEMCRNGSLKETSHGKYKAKSIDMEIIGRVDLTQRGGAFIISEQTKDDVYIPAQNLNKAFQDDLVKVRLVSKGSRKKQEGTIVEIIKRAITRISGVIEITKTTAFVIPNKKKIPVDIYVPMDKIKGATHGQRVIVEIKGWPKGTTSPQGEVVEVLGFPGENEAEIQSILADMGLPFKFPPEVEREADKIPVDISEEEISRRRDFRKILTFTIDPVDAKDFDDALSYRILDNGNTEVGVHIADVTHYLTENGMIDKEAVSRATSIYLVDRVVPMLPEVLSNFVCSLRPNEDKLCFSAVFEFDKDNNIKSEWFGKTIIHSVRRFSYEEVQDVLMTGEGDYVTELKHLDVIAKHLRKDRIKHGSILFNKVEVRFTLDEKKKPIGVYLKEQKDAHKLIEDFMLLANKKVAELIGKKQQKTFVYRIHDEPDPQKVETFNQFVRKMGYKINPSNQKALADSMNKLLTDIHGKKEENMVEMLAIRTMAKAEYSTKNIGHYGLAFDFYSHFTSPIRRYPDVMAHRLLFHYLNGGKSVAANHYEALCKHSSDMERKAVDAERESTKFFQVLMLSDKVGHIFSGLITGVSEWGIYVEVDENKCEGMVRMKEMRDDFYELDEKNYRVVGKRYKKAYQVGDKVQIKVKHVDLARKQLDFELVYDFTF